MILFNVLAGMLCVICFYKGLKERHCLKSANYLKAAVISVWVIVALIISWGLTFYYLNSLPMSDFNLYDFIFLYGEALPLGTTLLLYTPIITLCVFVLLCIASYFNALFKPKSHSAYGTAHFASKREIKKMGLLLGNKKHRIIVGDYKGELLTYPMSNHMLMFAPSRSGKGVSTVIPNALNWQGSMLCTDNKYEIYEYTSGYREKCGNEIYRFSPASKDFKTHCINPLDFIDKDNPAKRISDLQLILDILIAATPGENQMWAEEARSLTTGLLLWLLQSDKPFTLSELSGMVKGQNLDEFLTKVIEECVMADNLITIDIAAYVAIQNFLQKAEKEQSGVRSTLTGMLRLWEDPMVCAATNKSDFSFKDMRKRPISLYLSFGTGHISRLAPLINLIIQMFLTAMLDNTPTENEPHKVLCLLDEINRFGRMEKLKDGFGDLAGYGVHMLPIIQNVAQFYSTYGGRDESDIFFQNTDLKICFSQNTQTDKQFISTELGNKTVRIKTRSYATNHSGSNYSESFVERPLLTVEEVQRFSKKHQILITGEGVVKCKKIIYYQDERFKSKLLPAYDVPIQAPAYPSIEITKSIDTKEKSVEKSQDEKDKKRQEAQKVKEFGRVISESFAPLIDKATKAIEVPPNLIIDKKSGEVFESLSSVFNDNEEPIT